MYELTNILIAAREKKVYKDMDDFNVCFKKWNALIRGDIESGEQWVWIQNVAMVSTRIGIIFLDARVDLPEYADYFKEYEFVAVKDFDKKEWSINLKKLRREAPEIEWHACKDAIDPLMFSIKELYYATV